MPESVAESAENEVKANVTENSNNMPLRNILDTLGKYLSLMSDCVCLHTREPQRETNLDSDSRFRPPACRQASVPRELRRVAQTAHPAARGGRASVGVRLLAT